MYYKPFGFNSPTPEVCISAPICQSELSLLEGNGHEFHIDTRPRGSSAKIIDGQSFRFAVFDLGKWWKATIMNNPDRFVDHFKHCNTVNVGLGSDSDLTGLKRDFRYTPGSRHLLPERPCPFRANSRHRP